MKRSILQAKFYLLFVILLLAACTNDELAEQGTPLPEGMYPMTFTAVQQAPQPATPQTRVSDTNNGTSITSSWTEDDKIKVTVSNGSGYSAETTCTLSADGNIKSYDQQLYWQTTGNYTVKGYYSNVSGGNATVSNTVNFEDQSNGLAYVLKAKEQTASYKSENIKLEFEHQLAKVRVKLKKGNYLGELKDATVRVKGYTQCTVTNGTVSGKGNADGYITMCKNDDGYYEANLVPGVTLQAEAFEISADNKTAKANLNNAVELKAGNMYTLDITINRPAIEVTPGDSDQSQNLNDGDVVNISGSGKGAITFNIDENETATVNLNNVTLGSEDNKDFGLNLNGAGTFILKLNGTNTLKGFRRPIISGYKNGTSGNI